MLALLLLVAQDAADVQASVAVRDGSQLRGVIRFSSPLVLKTKFGESRIPPATLLSIERGKDGRLRIETNDGAVLTGEGSLGKLEIETSGGKLAVEDADILRISFIAGSPPPPSKPAPPKRRDPSKREPLFKGFEIRKRFDAAKAYCAAPDAAILVRSTSRAALLDYEAEECVVLDLPSGALTRLKVEAGPTCLIEKGGLIYVANRKSSSLTVIDAATLKARSRIVLPSPPLWLAAPAREELLYVLTEEGRAPIKVVDTRAGRLNGPLLDRVSGQPVFVAGRFLAVSPDHRMLFSSFPYQLVGGKASCGLTPPEGSPGPITFDFAAVRAYAGEHAYTLDLTRRMTTLPTTGLVPHPTRSLLFGPEKGTSTPYGSSGRVLVFDEEDFAPLAKIDTGDEVLALLPAEDVLYVVSPTHVYPVELAPHVPAAAMAKPKARRAPADLMKPPSEVDQKKAQQLAAQALAALDAGKDDDAKLKAEAAWAVDPLSNAKLVLAALVSRGKDPLPALDDARLLRSYPFRERSGTLRAIDHLGAALSACGRLDEALQTYYEGLVLDPESPRLLKGLGSQAKAQGHPAIAHAAWTKSLAADPKQADLKKSLEELTAQIIAATTNACADCQGSGKHEIVVEEAGKPRRKTIKECKTCAGRGKTWSRACVECLAGTWKKRTACDACLGAGHLPVPAPGKK